jgi:hypothetical protein
MEERQVKIVYLLRGGFWFEKYAVRYQPMVDDIVLWQGTRAEVTLVVHNYDAECIEVYCRD